MNIDPHIDRVIATPDDDPTGSLWHPDYCDFLFSHRSQDTFAIAQKYRITGADNVLGAIEWAQGHASGYDGFADLFSEKFVTDVGEEIEKMHVLYGDYPQGFEVPSKPDFSWTARKASDSTGQE
ncbi:hypothetical protein ACFPVT_03955 [Corynebacterium choanae]|uniref:Uncharacterized protein n=1 Tax=Corynebacterium choanae TaxID=1862358 RepID=A0A3G6J982_9CORY|nr:hypothetical protein [Corynebacterium choanae]AZA14342.1 hypothetical protein CCHOA_09795 [Corynebacterium choanae]